MTMASANEDRYWLHFPEPSLENPMKDLPECRACRGWGIVLGTDSPDSWGDPCTCGREFQRPLGVRDAQNLHAAHMQARLDQGVKVAHKNDEPLVECDACGHVAPFGVFMENGPEDGRCPKCKAQKWTFL